MLRFHNGTLVLGIASLLLTAASTPGFAMAKKPATGSSGGSCSIDGGGMTTPHPSHKVVVAAVGTKVFDLPNGHKVDLSADLNAIFNTSVGSTKVYVPTDAGGAADECGTHFEVSAGVTELDLDLADVERLELSNHVVHGQVVVAVRPDTDLQPVSGAQGPSRNRETEGLREGSPRSHDSGSGRGVTSALR